MSTPRTPLPFDDVFTSADLAGSGIGRSALAGWRARGEVVELSSGVYIPATATRIEEKRLVYASRSIAIGQHPVTLLGAAALHSLPLPSRRLDAWLRVDRHRTIPANHVRQIHGLLVPTLEWTAVNLARSQQFEDALIPLDAALRSGAHSESLRACASELAGGHGMRHLARAVSCADGSSESPLESVSRGVMLNCGLQLPELQTEIPTSHGRFRVDFYWPQFRLIGEADGRVKYTDADVLWQEKRRQLALEAQGYQVMRWSWEDITTGRNQWLVQLRALLGAKTSANRHTSLLPAMRA